MTGDQFSEEDEDPAVVRAAFEAGEKGLTGRSWTIKPSGFCRQHNSTNCYLCHHQGAPQEFGPVGPPHAGRDWTPNERPNVSVVSYCPRCGVEQKSEPEPCTAERFRWDEDDQGHRCRERGPHTVHTDREHGCRWTDPTSGVKR